MTVSVIIFLICSAYPHGNTNSNTYMKDIPLVSKCILKLLPLVDQVLYLTVEFIMLLILPNVPLHSQVLFIGCIQTWVDGEAVVLLLMLLLVLAAVLLALDSSVGLVLRRGDGVVLE